MTQNFMTFLIGMLLTNGAIAQDSGLFTSEQGKARLSVSADHKKVELKLLDQLKSEPRSVQITLRDEKNKELTMRLEPVFADQSREKILSYSGTLPEGRAGMKPVGSYVGFELKIPLSKAAGILFKRSN